MMGVSEDTITNWEKGRVKPKYKRYAVITEFLGYMPSIMNEMNLIGEKLKAYRKGKKMTQKYIAKLIGIGLNTYRGIENKESQILDSTKSKVLKFLKNIEFK